MWIIDQKKTLSEQRNAGFTDTVTQSLDGVSSFKPKPVPAYREAPKQVVDEKIEQIMRLVEANSVTAKVYCQVFELQNMAPERG